MLRQARLTSSLLALSALMLLSACPKRDAEPPDPAAPATTAAAAPQKSLAQRLPEDTIAYSMVDVKGMLALMERSLLFVDEDLGREMVVQAGQLHQGLLRMVRNRGMKAQLLDHWQETRIHLVVLRQQEAQAPAGEAKKPRRKVRGLWGEDVCVSLVVECQPAHATDFLDQLRALLVQEAEGGQGKAGQVFKELSVEHGRMLEVPGSGLTFGQTGGLLVFSDKKPTSLWRSLNAAPARSLTETQAYASASRDAPAWFFTLNLARMVKDWEESLTGRMKELEAQVDQPNPGIWRIEKSMAEQNLKFFHFTEGLLSLDRFHSLTGRMDVEFAGDVARFELAGQVNHEANVSPAMRALLDGGRKLVLPAGTHEHAFGFMWRFGLQDVYREVVERLDADDLATHQTQMAMVKAQTGYAVEDLLGLFSGDIYFTLDMEEMQTPANTEIKMPSIPKPVFSVILGVADRDKSLEAIRGILERTAPLTGTFVSRRSFQEEDVFMLGPKAASPDADPDSAGMMCAAVLDKHLVFGTWDKVTDLMRQRKAEGRAGGALARALAAHPEASLLLVASQKLSDQIKTLSGKDKTTEELIAEVRALELPDEDPQTVSMVTESLARLMELSDELQKRSSSLQKPVGILSGQAKSGRYELRIVNELKRGASGS